MADWIRVRRRRELFLLLLGALYWSYGAGLAFTPPAPSTHAEGWLGGILFGVTGAVALLVATVHRWHWVGYGALTVGSGAWAAQYLIGWVGMDHPGSWSGLLVWLLVTGVILLVAGWAEPPPRSRIERHWRQGEG